MKKLILIIILLMVVLTSCAPKPMNMYEVHRKDGSVVNVCADVVRGFIDNGITFYLRDSTVAMFSGDGIWFTSVLVESCE